MKKYIPNGLVLPIMHRFKLSRRTRKIDETIKTAMDCLGRIYYCELAQFEFRFKRFLNRILIPIRADVRKKLHKH